MIQEKMIHIKEEYMKNGGFTYLCHIAEELGVEEEFQEYLVNNLDDTMINQAYGSKGEARWFYRDITPRLNWLNKHIEILGRNKEVYYLY